MSYIESELSKLGTTHDHKPTIKLSSANGTIKTLNITGEQLEMIKAILIHSDGLMTNEQRQRAYDDIMSFGAWDQVARRFNLTIEELKEELQIFNKLKLALAKF